MIIVIIIIIIIIIIIMILIIMIIIIIIMIVFFYQKSHTIWINKLQASKKNLQYTDYSKRVMKNIRANH